MIYNKPRDINIALLPFSRKKKDKKIKEKVNKTILVKTVSFFTTIFTTNIITPILQKPLIKRESVLSRRSLPMTAATRFMNSRIIISQAVTV